MRLAEELVPLLPGGPGIALSLLLRKDGSEIELTTSSDQVHILCPEEGGLEPDLVRDVGDDEDRDGEVDGEEGLGIGLASKGPDGNPELGDEDNDVETEAEPGADEAGLGGEGELVEGVALDVPGATEANVSKADGAPGEDRGETRQCQHPVEGLVLLAGGGEEGEETEDRSEGNTGHGTAAAVNVGEDVGSLALLGERGEGTRGTVDGRVADGQDSNHNDHVEDVGEDLDAGILNGDDEGRGGDIDHGGGRGEAGLGVGDQETDDGERDNVEESDTPEHLLDGSGERLPGVRSLGGGETNQLGTGERERGGDEDGGNTLEAVGEGTGSLPVGSSKVSTIGSTTNVDDNTQDAKMQSAPESPQNR